MDQNMTSAPLLDENDIEALSLEDILRSKIEEAVRRVEMRAPAHMLESGHNFGDEVFWTDHDSGWVLLPDNFMRLVCFRMSDWDRTAFAAITADDPLYLRQSSRYKGIRGNYQKPICAIVNRPEGKALEFYSCKDNQAWVTQGVYRPYPRIDRNQGIEISRRCYEAVKYTAAALVAATYGDTDRASALSSLADNLSV